MNIQTLSLSFNHHLAALMSSLFYLIFVGGVLYIFLAISMTLLAHETEDIAKNISILGGELSELEHSYIALSEKVDMKLAYEMGFREDLRESVHIFRSNSATALLGRGEGF